MQRASKDLWDVWADDEPGFTSLNLQFDVAREWQGQSALGYWPDLDMLPIGQLSLRGPRGPKRASQLTRDEQVTMLTLWSMFGSPLMIGGELTSLPEESIRLLTNPSLLRINQTGRGGRELWRRGAHIAWRSELPGGSVALALFNLADSTARLALQPSDAPELRAGDVLDVWRGEPCRATEGRLEVDVPPHGARLFVVAAPAGAAP